MENTSVADSTSSSPTNQENADQQHDEHPHDLEHGQVDQHEAMTPAQQRVPETLLHALTRQSAVCKRTCAALARALSSVTTTTTIRGEDEDDHVRHGQQEEVG